MSRAKAILVENGFEFQQQEGHWKKGMGLLVAPQFAKLTVTPQGIELQAWLQFALLPGVFLGEFDLEGSFMIIPKRQLRKVVQKVENAVSPPTIPQVTQV